MEAESSVRVEKLWVATHERLQRLLRFPGERIFCQHPECASKLKSLKKRRYGNAVLYHHIVHHFDKQLYYCNECDMSFKYVPRHAQKTVHKTETETSIMNSGIITDNSKKYETELMGLLEMCFPETTARELDYKVVEQTVAFLVDTVAGSKQNMSINVDLETKFGFTWAREWVRPERFLGAVHSRRVDSKWMSHQYLDCRHRGCSQKGTQLRYIDERRVAEHLTTHFDGRLYECMACGIDTKMVRKHVEQKHKGETEISLLRNGIIRDFRSEHEDELIAILNESFPDQTKPQPKTTNNAVSKIPKRVPEPELKTKKISTIKNSPKKPKVELVKPKRSTRPGLRKVVVPPNKLSPEKSSSRSPVSRKSVGSNKKGPGRPRKDTKQQRVKIKSEIHDIWPTQSDATGISNWTRPEKLLSAVSEVQKSLTETPGERMFCQNVNCVRIGHFICKKNDNFVDPDSLLLHILHHFQSNVYQCVTCELNFKCLPTHLQLPSHAGNTEIKALESGEIKDLRWIYEEELVDLLNQCFGSKNNGKKLRRRRRTLAVDIREFSPDPPKPSPSTVEVKKPKFDFEAKISKLRRWREIQQSITCAPVSPVKRIKLEVENADPDVNIIAETFAGQRIRNGESGEFSNSESAGSEFSALRRKPPTPRHRNDIIGKWTKLNE